MVAKKHKSDGSGDVGISAEKEKFYVLRKDKF